MKNHTKMFLFILLLFIIYLIYYLLNKYLTLIPTYESNDMLKKVWRTM